MQSSDPLHAGSLSLHAGSPSCRAPTATLGLAPHCKDTFFGTCRLRVWQVDSAGRRSTSPLVDAVSTTAALEVCIGQGAMALGHA